MWSFFSYVGWIKGTFRQHCLDWLCLKLLPTSKVVPTLNSDQVVQCFNQVNITIHFPLLTGTIMSILLVFSLFLFSMYMALENRFSGKVRIGKRLYHRINEHMKSYIIIKVPTFFKIIILYLRLLCCFFCARVRLFPNKKKSSWNLLGPFRDLSWFHGRGVGRIGDCYQERRNGRNCCYLLLSLYSFVTFHFAAKWKVTYSNIKCASLLSSSNDVPYENILPWGIVFSSKWIYFHLQMAFQHRHLSYAFFLT